MARKSFLNRLGNKFSKQLVENATKAELKFKEFLDRYKFNYAFQKKLRAGSRLYIIDFVIPMNPKLVIEIDGPTHIGREAEDEERTRRILAQKKYAGYQLILKYTKE
jgi:very-short-patch-repair endonuclease